MYYAAIAEPNIVFVILMGMGTVLLGLTCIVFLCMLMSYVVSKLAKPDAPSKAVPAPAAPAAPTAIENRGELVAAIAAAVAEELGADVSAIRILSLKKIEK